MIAIVVAVPVSRWRLVELALSGRVLVWWRILWVVLGRLWWRVLRITVLRGAVLGFLRCRVLSWLRCRVLIRLRLV